MFHIILCLGMGASACVSPRLRKWRTAPLPCCSGPSPQTSTDQVRSWGLPARPPATRRFSATQSCSRRPLWSLPGTHKLRLLEFTQSHNISRNDPLAASFTYHRKSGTKAPLRGSSSARIPNPKGLFPPARAGSARGHPPRQSDGRDHPSLPAPARALPPRRSR